MGCSGPAKCKNCNAEFEVSIGGGFFFDLLRCDKCGKTKSVSFDDIPELHERYIKGLGGPYCVASMEQDKQIQDDDSIEPISEDSFHEEMEKFAGKCKCGGQFTYDAKPRCPKCLSTSITLEAPTTYYD